MLNFKLFRAARNVLGSVDVAKSRIPTFLVGIDKSKLSDEEWVQLVAGLKKIPGIRIGCEVNRA